MPDSQVIKHHVFALLLCHALALALFWWLPGWAARRDAARFNAAPAEDDLHVVFHRQRLLERVAIFAGIAMASSLPMVKMPWLFVLSTAGLLCAATGIWAFRFNPLLSEARNLPYVSRYYLSPDPRAAWFPDRLLTRLGWPLKPVLTACLLAGFVGDLLALTFLRK